MKAKTPIFIVGSPRSGTTLMRLILNSHPQIAIPDETDILSLLFNKPFYKRIKPFRVRENSALRNAIGNDIADKFNRLPFYKRIRARDILDFLFDSYAESFGKKYWGEKTPIHYKYIKQTKRVYPNSTVIFMVRDPRAVAASSKRYAGNKTGDNAGFWASEKISTATKLWEEAAMQAIRNKAAIVVVKYEDLVTAPMDTVKGVCEKIAIDFSPQMLDYYKSSPNNVATAKWHKETTKPINLNNLEKWKKELSAKEIMEIENKLQDYMRRFGYNKTI